MSKRCHTGDSAANNRVNLPVRSVTALANGASAAPAQPAGYAGRSTDMGARTTAGPGHQEMARNVMTDGDMEES
jgi:hypothetical protein